MQMNISSPGHFDLMLILFTFLCIAVRNFPSQRRARTTCNKQHTAQKTQIATKVYVDNTSSYTVLSCHHTKPNHAALDYTAFHYYTTSYSECLDYLLYFNIQRTKEYGIAMMCYYTTDNDTDSTLYTSYKVEAVISVVSFLMPHVTTGTAERPELLRARNRFRR